MPSKPSYVRICCLKCGDQGVVSKTRLQYIVHKHVRQLKHTVVLVHPDVLKKVSR